MKETILNVEGMSCEHCKKAVTNALYGLDGVASVDVDLPGKTVAVKYDAEKITPQAIQDEIVNIGYEIKSPT